jgi:hypothetical protein
MFEGQLLGIFLAAKKRSDLNEVSEAEVVLGQGLVGDRYFLGDGTFFKDRRADQEVTLIEVEAIEGLRREYDISLQPGQTRRNLVTRGVPLNQLVGKDFAVGEVILRGHRLCEPCDHLERLTVAGVKKGLVHRGGLRAQVVRGGVVRKGDAVRPR